jgi:tetrahydromethanopterin S-methyltransferase subunit G
MAPPDANDIHRSLGRLEGKMDAILSTVAEAAITSAARYKETHENAEKLENRLRAVEAKMNWYAGIGVVTGFIGTQLIGPIWRLFKE